MTTSHQRFQPIERLLTPHRIVEQFQQMIATKQLVPGDRLPPERVLATLFGVGRSTMREAMRALESLGLVEVHPGQGTFLRAVDGPLTIIARPALSCSDYRTILEARWAVEPSIAWLAAARATPETVECLRQVLTTQAAVMAKGGTGAELDLDFHVELSRTAANPALHRIRESLEEALRVSRPILERMASRMELAYDEHKDVLTAIVERNSARAEQAMAVHLEAVQAWAAGLPCWCGGCTTLAG
jgi:GntR family transcriptional repressor for pyruvate dehydrogenase complex